MTGAKIDLEALKKELGEGPMRFAPHGERPIEEQIKSLTEEEKKCFDELKKKWEAKEDRSHSFSDEMILRFARCSPGKTKFNVKTAWKVMNKYNAHYLELTAGGLEKQLLTKTLFVVPGLKSKEGHDVFYMRPSRYFPKQTTVKEIIDNLAYCMQVMVEKEKACTEGIAFFANMADWSMSNFGINYCHQFMMMLQGRVPVRVRLFLIVNPPGWFGTIWKIMKPMLAPDFRKKVHMISADKLEDFFDKDSLQYLPDEFEGGKVSTEDIAKDFVAYRKKVEG
uniref:CRAL-TRIO domain-containing protein n=1 Tax=Grammatophora oceanica TaxID=210454 RepID=A0A7S1VJ89_9STRA|mmetsp:Transcript_47998/g.71525  ORF Transcript_47998/g.71525 Transcript_47998/m.71525 type:complete len:280 (+) Transcript_47998:47-886(+)